jgi:hypothetical protein
VKRPIFPPNIRVVIARFRRRDHEVVINFRGDVEVAIDRAVNEFDFQNMQPLAVTDGGESGGSNALALEVGNKTRRIRRRWRIGCNGRCEQEYACAQRNGGTAHGMNEVTWLQRLSGGCRITKGEKERLNC